MVTSVSSAGLTPSNESTTQGRIATKDEILLLKRDVLAGKIKIGQTRLKQIRDAYGDASNIKETEKKLTYDYGDLKIEFQKNQYFRDWAYDYSQKYLFKDEIDDLRYDLEDGQIAGEYYTYRSIAKDYGDPTVAYPQTGDGAFSTYYWSEVKIVFENVIVVSSVTGDKLNEVDTSGVLKTSNSADDVMQSQVK